MYYVLTEDSKSGFDVWSALILLGDTTDSECEVKSFGNNRGLSNAIGDIAKGRENDVLGRSLTKNDIVIVAYDNFVKQFRREIKRNVTVLQNKGYNIVYCKYDSVEQVFLTFDYFLDWIGKLHGALDTHSKRLLHVYRSFKQSSENGLPLFYKDKNLNTDVILQSYLDSIGVYDPALNAPKTKEKVLASLIAEMTANTDFQVMKSKFGPCWKLDCCWFKTQYGAQAKSRCGNKQLQSVSPIAKYKLMTLANTSILNRCLDGIGHSNMSLAEVLGFDRNYDVHNDTMLNEFSDSTNTATAAQKLFHTPTDNTEGNQ
jgi:hypothetical protein